MNIKSNFNIDDKVYFYSDKSLKVKIGFIRGISLYINEDGAIKSTYYIADDKHSILNETIPESLIFRSRDEVFKFAYTITEGI